LRELEKYWRSAAPDGKAPTSVQGMPTPAFQPDTVYSPAGDSIGNFQRGSADTETRLATTSRRQDRPLAVRSLTGSMEPGMAPWASLVVSLEIARWIWPRRCAASARQIFRARKPTISIHRRMRRAGGALSGISCEGSAPLFPTSRCVTLSNWERGRSPSRCWGYSAASRYCRFRMRYGVCRIDPAHLPAAPCPIFWPGLAGEIQRIFRRMTTHADLIATSVGNPGSSKASARRGSAPASRLASPQLPDRQHLNTFDTSGKSPAYLHHRKNSKARAGKPAAGFFNPSFLNRTAAARHGATSSYASLPETS